MLGAKHTRNFVDVRSVFEDNPPVGDDLKRVLRRLERCAAHFFNGQLALAVSADNFHLQDNGSSDQILLDDMGLSICRVGRQQVCRPGIGLERINQLARLIGIACR